ncbi:MAG: hypothetical protein N3B11_03355 [Coriobacteriia bacterium]|nr:hypothetical protein [Coriobacteriia bacterium]
METLRLHFSGPLTFSSGDRCLFESPLGARPCVYLWTVRRASDGVHLIHYIGEASRFAARQREHLTRILGLDYGIFDPAAARQGELSLLWPGFWRDKSQAASAAALECFAALAPTIVEYVRTLCVFVAPLDVDRRLRRHIEGSIARSLREKHPDCAALYPSDNRTGISQTLSGYRLEITSDAQIAGLDPVLET